ncbi:MAG: sialidase family protein [Acidobacteria bacterium]|nr:sialidase family protein [Acidobacteriota bacterium]
MPISKHLFALLTAASIVAATGCGSPAPADWTTTVQLVASPVGENSSEPQLSVSDRGVLLSWIERVGTTTYLKFSEQTATGWTPAMTAASGEDWFLSYADVPSVMRMSNGTLVAQWLVITERFYEAYDLLLSYSQDDGATWAPPFKPHHDGTTSMHGFASFVEMANGDLGLIWLDGRNSAFDFDDPETGTMMLRFTSYDANWNQAEDVEIDRRVCECCPTTAVMTDDGVLAGYRDLIDETQVRDIGVSRLDNGAWTPTTTVSEDNWEIYACPVNGPMLSANGRNVVAAWFTVKDDLGQSYAAFSNDAGRTWDTPIRLDDGGSLGRVDVEMLNDGTALATWVEYAEGLSDFRLRLVAPTGERSAPIPVAAVSGGRASGFPRLARSGNKLVFAWSESASVDGEDNGALTVQTAVAALP